MALNGKTNDEKIWRYLRQRGLNEFGVAGLMGNLYAESGLNPQNLQNTYEKKLGFADASYTKAVDMGRYQNFVKDKAGYGLAQWTFWSRKQNLLNFARATGKSIGDLEMQLDFLWKELSESYPCVVQTLCSATSVLEASNAVLLQFERPADQSVAVQKKRAGFGQGFYKRFANAEAEEIDAQIFVALFNEMRQGLRTNASGAYSAEAREWALRTGLIAGNGTLINGEPNYMWQDFLTREQLVAVLYRFCQMVGV